jgi:hypothetical protein
MACLSLGKRECNDFLAAIILSRDVSLVHVLERPAIQVPKAFIAYLEDSAASGYSLADGRKPQGKALTAFMKVPPTTERQGEVRKIYARDLRSFRVIVVETPKPGFQGSIAVVYVKHSACSVAIMQHFH